MRNGNCVNYKRDYNCCLSSTQKKKIESLISFCIFLVSYFICAFSHELYLNLVYSSRFRWLIKTAMRPVGPFDSSPSFAQHNDCVLVVGVSRPKLAAVFLTIMIISLFLTFHVLYDSAIYSIQVNEKKKYFICVQLKINFNGWHFENVSISIAFHHMLVFSILTMAHNKGLISQYRNIAIIRCEFDSMQTKSNLYRANLTKCMQNMYNLYIYVCMVDMEIRDIEMN